MRMEQRMRVLDIARQHGAWIIEDDFDSEYRFRGQPIPAMQGVDDDERTIYVGTFSKTLFPALRIGFMVLPEPLGDAIRGLLQPASFRLSACRRRSPTSSRRAISPVTCRACGGSTRSDSRRSARFVRTNSASGFGRPPATPAFRPRGCSTPISTTSSSSRWRRPAASMWSRCRATTVTAPGGRG